jgi:hypothetical protein
MTKRNFSWLNICDRMPPASDPAQLSVNCLLTKLALRFAGAGSSVPQLKIYTETTADIDETPWPPPGAGWCAVSHNGATKVASHRARKSNSVIVALGDGFVFSKAAPEREVIC